MLRLPLADEILLLGHDRRSGKPVVHGAILDVVLAAALIAELVIVRRVHVADNRLFVVDGRPMSDAALNAVLSDFRQQGNGQPLGVWVGLLRPEARRLVLQRLSRSGLVTLAKGRGPRSRDAVRVQPADELATLDPWLRLRYFINTLEPATVDAPTAALAALAHVLMVDQARSALDLAASRRRVRESMGGAAVVLPPDLKMIVHAADSAAEAMIMLRTSR